MNTAKFPQRLFVTGTDTDVGKTLISTLLMLRGPYRYWKPVQSGSQEETDTAQVKRLSALPEERFAPPCYMTGTPCSPHLSARIEGIEIEIDAIRRQMATLTGSLLVEGAGGLYVPLNRKATMLDLIRILELPVLLVARSSLGTINHTLLSVAALRQAGIQICGVVMSGPFNPENRKAIEQFGQIPVLAEVPWLDDMSSAALSRCSRTCLPGVIA